MRGLATLRAMEWGKRARIARWVAMGVDALQIAIFPILFPGSPWNNLLDVLTGAFMVAIVGWHVAFLPTFVTELVPFVDLFPTWTLAVLYVTRKRRGPDQRDQSGDNLRPSVSDAGTDPPG